MDCAQMRQLVLDGGAPTTDEARQHLDECLACRTLLAEGPALARLLAGAQPGSEGAEPSFAELEGQLARERAEIRPRLAELPTRLRWGLAAAMLAVPLFVGLLLHRHNLAAYPTGRLAAELGSLAALALTSCWLWLRPLFKPQPNPAKLAMVLALALAVPLTLALLPPALPVAVQGPLAHGALRRAAGCLIFGSLIATPALLLLLGLGRRAAGPSGFAVLPATAAALAGLFGLELHCPDASPTHLIMGHAPIALLLPLLLVGLRRLAARREYGVHFRK